MFKRILLGMLCCMLAFSVLGCGAVSPILPSQPPSGSDSVVPPDNGGKPLPPESDGDTVPLPPSNPEPSPEPKPEPPKPEPPINRDVLVTSNSNGLRVRSGAGIAFDTLGTLDAEDSADFVALLNGWYKIAYKNGFGYVSADYCVLTYMQKAGEAVERVIEAGKTLLGLPYVFGAQRYHWGNGGLNSGFDGLSYDCSSLTQYIYKIGANVNLSTTSRAQSQQGTLIAKHELRRGDLMFFTNDSRFNNVGIERIGHVAMFLGDNLILHTASDHAVIEPISAKRWGFFINARRLV